MNVQQAANMEHKLQQFRKLESRYNEILAAIGAFNKENPDGPCGQGPFTSNTRESRRITTIRFDFSPTLGGSPAVTQIITGLELPAPEVRNLLRGILEKQRDAVKAELEAL